MPPRRRRTDELPRHADLPGDARDRMHAICDALVRCGFADAFAFSGRASVAGVRLFTHAGSAAVEVERAAQLARSAMSSGRTMTLASPPPQVESMPMAAVLVGDTPSSREVVIIADPRLSRREAEAVAAWSAPADLPSGAGVGSCGHVARELAAQHAADAVVLALFAETGMLLNLHVRSGGLLRTWRLPVDTVWGEAARHEAAFMLGELQMHPGAESLASLGMQTAAIVGMTSSQGTALGSVGLASRGHLDVDVPRLLLGQAADIGSQVMNLRATTPVPVADADGLVELRLFAARVGCRRFAMYSLSGHVLRLASAHAEDGSVLVSPPDPYEEQLVCWAAEKRIAVVSENAAAVMVGDDTVLYAQDPGKRAIDCLRRALHDLRRNPYLAGGEQAA
jgi:hypothetical protein